VRPAPAYRFRALSSLSSASTCFAASPCVQWAKAGNVIDEGESHGEEEDSRRRYTRRYHGPEAGEVLTASSHSRLYSSHSSKPRRSANVKSRSSSEAPIRSALSTCRISSPVIRSDRIPNCARLGLSLDDRGAVLVMSGAVIRDVMECPSYCYRLDSSGLSDSALLTLQLSTIPSIFSSNSFLSSAI
jgi:hypothetical protein